MATCRGCGAEIDWIETKNGKFMPVDPEWIVPDDAEIADILVSEDGEVRQAQNVDPSKVWFISHFATCPKADNFRK